MPETMKEKEIQEMIKIISKAKETDDWSSINLESSKKRVRWYEENKDKFNLQGTDVRKAYTLLIELYLGLSPDEVPVVYEDDKRIVWKSYNWCSVLETCKRLGFDTREVCRKGWEQSVQALIEKINPKLRFSRNYENIRPHAEYCEESIELVE